MSKYYCLIAGLPNIALDDSKLTYSVADFRTELAGILSAKDKKLVETDIKDKIEILKPAGDNLLYLKAHCGSASNLSPDLVIDALIKFSGSDVRKYDFGISRDRLIFSGEWEDDF